MRERQLPLDLAHEPRFGREDFLPSAASRAALDMLDRWPDWPDRVLLILGPEGAGKSHLAAIWATEAQAIRLDGDGIAGFSPATWSGAPLLVEDADRRPLPEAPFFHLLNLVRERRSSLLVTARSAPNSWGLRTPDLLSRLRLAPQVLIAAPDDGLMRAVLVKLFADRQLRVDEDVVAFLEVRLGRSLGEARAVVEALDHASLVLGRRVTRPMAAQVLDTLGQDDEQDEAAS